PTGQASTINNWIPPEEKATATGVYIAASMFEPTIVPPLAGGSGGAWGWRWGFFSFFITGILAGLACLSLIYTLSWRRDPLL
ncbi:MFS transporter, partial [Klebsiella pneumoniae]|uniref:MFS transporter n=1 Tax=Klebsiella pneumoniae TaxID=573 RepID=UPI0019398767